MRLSQFVHLFPPYGFDFEEPLRNQERVFDTAQLDPLPVELEAEMPYQAGGRGRPNPNQSRTHSQCATCHRVLRNDYFYTLPSMQKRNVVYSHCRQCSQELNAGRYEMRAEIVRARREVIWHYLAPRCAACGFDKHASAMDLHHLEDKESHVAELITNISLTLEFGKIEALFRHMAKCVPLCSNCHRMLHAGVSSISNNSKVPTLRIASLMDNLKSLE